MDEKSQNVVWINNSRTTWCTLILMLFLSSLDNYYKMLIQGQEVQYPLKPMFVGFHCFNRAYYDSGVVAVSCNSETASGDHAAYISVAAKPHSSISCEKSIHFFQENIVLCLKMLQKCKDFLYLILPVVKKLFHLPQGNLLLRIPCFLDMICQNEKQHIIYDSII